MGGAMTNNLRMRREAVTPVVDELVTMPFGDVVQVAGSYRRKRDTVADIEIVVCNPSVECRRWVAANLERAGKHRATGLYRGIQVDMVFTTPQSHGAALLYFTGSAQHNIYLRGLAKARGMLLNEYGLWTRTDRTYRAGATESDIFDALGLDYIEPCDRERKARPAPDGATVRGKSGTYTVTPISCTCPHWMFRLRGTGQKCKHMRRAG